MTEGLFPYHQHGSREETDTAEAREIRAARKIEKGS
jgi:hypothetical protein